MFAVFASTNLVQTDKPAEAGKIVDKSDNVKIGEITRINPKVLLCRVDSSKLELDDTNNFASKILGLLGPKKAHVIVLTTERLVNFRGDDIPDSRSFSRILKSSEWKAKINCNRLEQPNIIGGLPAAGNC